MHQVREAPPGSSDESSEKWQGRFRSRADDSSERHEGWDGVWALPVPLHLTRRTLRNAVHLIKPLSDIRDKFYVFPSRELHCRTECPAVFRVSPVLAKNGDVHRKNASCLISLLSHLRAPPIRSIWIRLFCACFLSRFRTFLHKRVTARYGLYRKTVRRARARARVYVYTRNSSGGCPPDRMSLVETFGKTGNQPITFSARAHGFFRRERSFSRFRE